MLSPSLSVRISNLTQHQWTNYLLHSSYSAYQQHWAYAEALKTFGADCIRADILYGEETIGLAQIQLRRAVKFLTIALCMRGPVWLRPDIDEAVKAGAYVELSRSLPISRPRFTLWMPESDDTNALRLARKRRVMTGYGTVLLDLTQNDDALLAQLDGKWRNRLKAAESSALQLHKLPANVDNYGFLLEQEAEQSRRIGYAALHPKFVPIYQAHAGQDKPLCLVAKHHGDIVAGLLCLIHGPFATYHIGWSSEEGKKLNAHNALLWMAFKELKKKNIRTLDLGGVNTEDGAGIARFKLGTGGAVNILSGTYL